MGAYHGRVGFDTFSHLRGVLRRPTTPDPSIAYPPYGPRDPQTAPSVPRLSPIPPTVTRGAVGTSFVGRSVCGIRPARVSGRSVKALPRWGGGTGRPSARYLLCRSFSDGPRPEPDVPVSVASGSPVTTGSRMIRAAISASDDLAPVGLASPPRCDLSLQWSGRW